MKKLLTLGAALSLCAFASSAQAGQGYYGESMSSTSSNKHYSETETPLKVSLGAMGTYGDYAAIGIEDDELMALPIINVEYGNWTIGTIDGLKYKFVNDDAWEVKAGVTYDMGRDDDDLPSSREGLGDIDGGAAVEASVKYKFMDGFHTGLKLTKSFAEGKGMLATAHIGYETMLTEKLTLGLTAKEVWADDKYMEEYFGISDQQAIDTGLATFDADSGFKNASLSLDLKYSYTENWDFKLGGGANFFQGDANDSNVTKDDVVPFVKAGFVYNF